MASAHETRRPRTPGTAALLDAYRAELLRWNKQMNLLSRRDPELAADALIRQCAAAFDLWWSGSGAALVGAGGALRVFDLGSGGGLPGFVWLALLAEHGVALDATLIEPREKRAWFLSRLPRLLAGSPSFAVVAARWGEAAADGAGQVPGIPILLTLKALRLSDAAVLDGLATSLTAPAPAPGTAVEIVRFHPALGITATRLARELEIPDAGEITVAGPLRLEAVSRELLKPARGRREAAGLMMSRHVVLAAEG